MKTFILKGLLFTDLLISSTACSNDDDDGCVHCTADCEVEDKTLNYCGGDMDDMEAAFRAQNEGCAIECTRNNDHGY